jgi:FKBP-type peptidyl-prolyl cis-trans isomerase FkpA
MRMLSLFVLAMPMAVAVPSALHAQAAAVDAGAVFLQHNRAEAGVVETSSGLQYKVLRPSRETVRPSADDVVLVMYKGRLTSGTVFDQSEQPVPMEISGVVPGFSEALTLMGRGAQYRVWIKPSLGYGDQASGPIPANSVLVFDIEMIDWKTRVELMLMQQRRQQLLQQQTQPPGAPVQVPAPPPAH